jgi:hypothetical protein
MPSKGREMIEHVRAAFGVSIRKRCRAIPACRATYHYRTANCVRARAELAGTREIRGKRACQALLVRWCFMPCLHLKQQTTVLSIL